MTPQFRVSGFIGDPPATADALAAFLAAANGQAVEVVINSAGGSAFEGAAMLAELRRHPGFVTVLVEGIAASAASLIAMGGDLVLVDASAFLMIHDPSSLTIGNADDHRASADTLDRLARTYAEAYATRSGNRVEDVAGWMSRETWLDATEATALGFADRVVGGEAAQPRASLAQAHAQWAATMRQNERKPHVPA